VKHFKTMKILLAGASCLALSYGAAYAAEDADATKAAAPEADSTVVVVTAMKRSQTTLAVPAAITALSGNDLKAAGVNTVDDVQNVAPSVTISRNGFGVNTSIRGVTTTDTTSKGEQGVAFNIDGVSYGRPVQQGLAFFDVNRVEVLRGPQGTLYGKSSTGGVINLVTNAPNLAGFDANATFDIGNYNARRFQGMVNVPLSDQVAVRLAVSANKRDGYLTPVDGSPAAGYHASAANLPARNDEDNETARFSILYKPSDNARWRITATGGHVGGYGPGEGVYDIMEAADNSGKSALNILPNPVVREKDDKFFNVDSELNFKIGGVAVTYLAGIQHFDAYDPVPTNNNPLANYAGAGPFQPLYVLGDNRWDVHALSHEIRFANAESSVLDYVFGANYISENIHENSHVWNIPLASPNDTSTWFNARNFLNSTSHMSVGLFGQLTWHSTSKLDLILGLRESKDELQRFGMTAIGLIAGCTYPDTCKGSANNGLEQASKLTYRIGANYHLNTTDMIYGSIATGYKAGGFNDFDPATHGISAYDPEELTAYELGYKGRPFANMTYSTSLFYYDYAGDQISSRIIVSGTAVLYTRLVPATIYGWEHELSYRFSSNTNASLAATFEHSEYKTFMAGIAQNVDWSGTSLDRTPDVSATASLNHTFTLPNSATLKFRGGVKYSSSYLLSDFVNAVQFTQKAFTRSDIVLTYAPVQGHYSVELYAQNLENQIQKVGIPETYKAGIVNSTTFPISTPRFIGMRLNLQY
jgi:iron complex outermembrane receptor protein